MTLPRPGGVIVDIHRLLRENCQKLSNKREVFRVALIAGFLRNICPRFFDLRQIRSQQNTQLSRDTRFCDGRQLLGANDRSQFQA
jgi:hypothetical protein